VRAIAHSVNRGEGPSPKATDTILTCPFCKRFFLSPDTVTYSHLRPEMLKGRTAPTKDNTLILCATCQALGMPDLGMANG
jgi:hypothetical protein